MDDVDSTACMTDEDDFETEDWSGEFDAFEPGASAVYDSHRRQPTCFGGFKNEEKQESTQRARINTDSCKSKGSNLQEENAGTSGIPVNRMALNDHKAGMGGLDKEKINRIIYETSKGSLFYENERKKQERVNERVAKLKKALSEITDAEKVSALKDIDAEVEKLEMCRDLSRTIVHIDMDAFYAAVEIRDNPELKHKPMAVGGLGMLSTSNYVARSYGVRAGMPGFIGKKLCPDLILIQPHFDKYRAVSEEVKKVLVNYDQNFSMGSLDEAYLDITDYMKNFTKERERSIEDETAKTKVSFHHKGHGFDITDGEEAASDKPEVNLSLAELVVQQLRREIFEKTSLTASAGIAPNNMLAKICSDRNKPNGQYFLQPYRPVVLNFIRCLPIRKVFGIGRVSEQILNSLGIMTCQDIFDNRAILKLLFSSIAFDSFLRISLGISSNCVGCDADRKSISTEMTFGKISEPKELLKMCDNLCKLLAKDIASEQIQGKTVTVKFKLVNFEIRSRAKSLPVPVSVYEDINRIAKDIVLREIKAFEPSPLELRLMGVRLSDLSSIQGKEQNKIKAFFKKQDTASQMQSSDDNKAKDTIVTNENVEASLCTPKSLMQSQTMPLISTMFSKQTDKGSSRSITPAGETVECPICGLKIPLSFDINIHIDSCLNTKAIEELNEETPSSNGGKVSGKRKRGLDSDPNSSTKQTLLNYFHK